MAEEDEAIDAEVDIGDTLKTLLEATRSQATVNAALVTQLMNINTTQAALQVQIAAIAAPPPGPIDPVTKQSVNKITHKPAQLAMPAPPTVPDKPAFATGQFLTSWRDPSHGSRSCDSSTSEPLHLLGGMQRFCRRTYSTPHSSTSLDGASMSISPPSPSSQIQ